MPGGDGLLMSEMGGRYSSRDDERRVRPLVVGFESSPWDQGWSSRHRQLSGLGQRRWTVVYSSGALTIWGRGKDSWRRASLFGRIEQAETVLVDRPGRLSARWPRARLWDVFTLRQHARRIRSVFDSADDGPIVAILFHPIFWPYLASLAPSHVVYFVTDSHSLAPGWTSELREFESRLTERADLIVGYSREMLDLLPGEGPTKGRVLPTGVDFTLFANGAQSDKPADLVGVPHPRVGYFGRINQKLDARLVTTLAEQDPTQHWVFVGPVVDTSANTEFAEVWRECSRLPNVHHLGPKAHGDVPAYMCRMDVNVMCYRTEGGWWTAGYPLKMHEYLAVGVPIVSADLSTVRPFADVLAIARTPEE